MFVFLVFCLGAADTIGRKICLNDGAGCKIAAIPVLGIASEKEHDQVKTNHEEGPK